MTTKDIAKKYGIDKGAFEAFMKEEGLSYSEAFFNITVNDKKVEDYVERYRELERLRMDPEGELRKKRAMAQMLISSGFNFEGYRIVKYSGYISGDDAIQIPRSGVYGINNGKNLTDALVKIRRQALIELKEAAYDLDCNAVIGVDFDYITLEPETANRMGGNLYETYVICVTANGNAVVIEKIEE